MAEVHHVHHHDTDEGMSAVMMVVLLIALVGLALFTFFALNGLPRTTTPSDDIDVGIEGQINLPDDSVPDGQ
ncbi:hypothetical protein HYZ99_02935 [Candidatus Peregrinibacteria bacterium]|nr:hypothetical protein [Candidatus Peregrinibacteria bacterium]